MVSEYKHNASKAVPVDIIKGGGCPRSSVYIYIRPYAVQAIWRPVRTYGKYRVSLKLNSSELVCCREMDYTPFERGDVKLFNDIKTLPGSYLQMHLLYTTK